MALTIIIFTVGKSCKPFCINEFKPFEFENLQKSSLAFNVTLQISSSSLDPLQLGRATVHTVSDWALILPSQVLSQLQGWPG